MYGLNKSPISLLLQSACTFTLKYSPCMCAAGGRFHPGFILCDPYAVRAVPVVLPESAYANAAKMPPKLDLARPVVLASLSAFVQVCVVNVFVCLFVC